jgi:hypothetical protein
MSPFNRVRQESFWVEFFRFWVDSGQTMRSKRTDVHPATRRYGVLSCNIKYSPTGDIFREKHRLRVFQKRVLRRKGVTGG